METEEEKNNDGEQLMRQIRQEIALKVGLYVLGFVAVIALMYWYGEKKYDPNAPVNYTQEEYNGVQDTQDNSYRGF